MGKKFLDVYSYLHFASGIIFYYFGFNFKLSLLIHTLFEYLENTKQGMYVITTYFRFWPGGKSEPDNLLNILSDTVFFCIGWLSAYLLNKKYKNVIALLK